MTHNSAYLLITCDIGKFEQVKEQLERIDDIKDFQGTYGSYDIIAKVESLTRQHMQKLIAHQIRTLAGVRSALTLECKPNLQVN